VSESIEHPEGHRSPLRRFSRLATSRALFELLNRVEETIKTFGHFASVPPRPTRVNT
jgi:hypothetical protein